jgi:hypothetical protein
MPTKKNAPKKGVKQTPRKSAPPKKGNTTNAKPPISREETDGLFANFSLDRLEPQEFHDFMTLLYKVVKRPLPVIAGPELNGREEGRSSMSSMVVNEERNHLGELTELLLRGVQQNAKIKSLVHSLETVFQDRLGFEMEKEALNNDTDGVKRPHFLAEEIINQQNTIGSKLDKLYGYILKAL